MASDLDNKSAYVLCIVCGYKFSNIQECLKHELLDHSLKKNCKQHNRLERKLNDAAKFLNSEEKMLERERLQEQLNKCDSGQELATIFRLFCMDTDNLDLIIKRIQTCLEQELRSVGVVRVYPFGSVACGLALRDCDIDLYLDASLYFAKPKKDIQNNDDKVHWKKVYNCIDRRLQRSPHFDNVYAIRRAKVPIIKCKHKDTGFNIDLNVSCPSSRINTQFIYDVVKSDERIHETILFLKLWAKNTQIVGRNIMTSYCLVTMVIFFLQQPLKSTIQKTGAAGYRILKSIKELQKTSAAHMVEGVNYAYDLRSEENKPKIPAAITTWYLIKEFFNFYQNFVFDFCIISPYYGKLLKKTDSSLSTCKEHFTQCSLVILQDFEGEKINRLKTESCMCVQDSFNLNQNIAKNITPANKQYFLLCVQKAKKICENPYNLQLSQLYEQLLFENINVKVNEIKFEEIEKLMISQQTPTISKSQSDNNNKSVLVHKVVFTKADMCAVTARYPDKTTCDEILRCWRQCYIDSILTILTELYLMDIEKQHPTQQKQQKLDKKEKEEELNQSFLISCTIDLWSNRCFQAKTKPFMAFQLEQTKRLYAFRRQDPKFSVKLSGILKLNILPDYKGIDVFLEFNEDTSISNFGKKSPFRKFTNVFKNTLESFSLKWFLYADKTNADKTTAADTTTEIINAKT